MFIYSLHLIYVYERGGKINIIMKIFQKNYLNEKRKCMFFFEVVNDLSS